MSNIKRKKFIELANKRVNKAIAALRLVGNLSNRSNYDYSEEDIKKIFRALDSESKFCRSLFEKKGHQDLNIFSLE